MVFFISVFIGLDGDKLVKHISSVSSFAPYYHDLDKW